MARMSALYSFDGQGQNENSRLFDSRRLETKWDGFSERDMVSMSNETAQREKELATQAVPILLRYLIYGAFALAVVSTLVGSLFSMGETTTLLSVLGITAGLLVLVQALPSGRVIQFAIGPVTAKLGRVEHQQSLQQSEIDAIRTALRGIIVKHEFGPLKALETGEAAKIIKEPNLVNYLHRLDGLNFIQPNPGHGLNDIENIADGEMFDLKDYLHITEDGRKYLDTTTETKNL
jgi:hypothetical protein